MVATHTVHTTSGFHLTEGQVNLLEGISQMDSPGLSADGSLPGDGFCERPIYLTHPWSIPIPGELSAVLGGKFKAVNMEELGGVTSKKYHVACGSSFIEAIGFPVMISPPWSVKISASALASFCEPFSEIFA